MRKECPGTGSKTTRNARCGKEGFLFSLISDGNRRTQNTTESLSSGREDTGQFRDCQAHELKPLLTERAGRTA